MSILYFFLVFVLFVFFFLFFFFFFQAEDGIRDLYVTGVQTCALPISMVQQAGIVALREGEAYVRELRAQYAARRAQVVDALSDVPGVSLPEPQGEIGRASCRERV